MSFLHKSGWRKRTLQVVASIIIGLPVLALALILFVNLFNWNYARSLLASASRSFTPYEVRVDGDWKMHIGRNFELTLTDFSVNARDYPSDEDPLVKSERFFLRVPVASLFKRRKVIDSLELSQTRVHLLRNEEGKMVFLPPDKKDKKKDKGPTAIPELNEVEILDFALAYEDKALKETVNLTVDRIRSLAGGGFEPIHVQGKGDFEGQPFSLQATWDDQSRKNEGPFQWALLTTIGKNRLVADGHVEMDQATGGLGRADASLQADMKDPARLMRMAGIPSRAPVSFSADGKFTADGDRIGIDSFHVKTARSEAMTKGSLTLEKRRPKVDLVLDAPRFDLRDVESFLPPAEEKKEGGEKKTGPVLPREPINTAALHSIDAQLKFDVKKFHAENALAVLESVRGTLTLENGNIDVKIDDLGLGGGHLEATAAVETEKGKDLRMSTRGTFRDVSLVAAAKPFEDTLKKAGLPAGSLLGGDLSGDFGLKTAGPSIHGLAANLDGALSFALEDGQLNASLLDLANLDIVDAVKAWFAKQRGLKVPCVLAYLPIKDGVIRSEGAYANSPLGELLVDGYVDLGKEVYDVRVATKGDAPIGSDVLFPLHVTGKFGGGKPKTERGDAAKDESIKQALPHAEQKSVQVEQTKETTGCTKELRERYLPARNAATAH